MPKLNARGDIAAGRGGGIVSVNNVMVLPFQSGEACWLDDDRVIAQHCTGEACQLVTYDVRTGGATKVADRGANHIFAGGGVWAAWLGKFGGIYTSAGREFKGAGLGAVGPDGAIAICHDYQAGHPWDVIEQDGSRWRLTDRVAGNINLLGHGTAVWSEPGGLVIGRGGPTPLVLTVPFYGLRVLEIDGQTWSCYQDSTDRLVCHPFDGRGYVVTVGAAYRPDIVRLPSGLVRVAWSTSEGEPPGAQRFRDLDLRDARVDLRRSVPVPPVVPPPVPPVPPEPVPMPERNHADVVARIAATIPHERTLAYAWKLVTAVSWELRGEGCGLHDRPPSGENVMTVDGQTYGASRVMYPDGDLYKLVSDAGDGGANGPQWAREDPIDPARWRPALKPEAGSPEPEPEPTPGRTLEDLWTFIVDLKQFENTRLEGIDARLDALRAEVNTLKQVAGPTLEGLIVEGRTDTARLSLSHSHAFTGTVKAKP